MRQVVIENPVLNSPYSEPTRHFRFDEEGITNEVVEERRISSYFVPVAKPRKRGKQMVLDTEWTEERIKENEDINRIRQRVALWRKGGYQGITNTTRRLLEHWQRPDRDPNQRLFFCQIEALETLIYVTEVARKYGDAWMENALRAANENANPGLYRIAMKMATGSGKTVVMAMLIAWHVLNKLADKGAHVKWAWDTDLGAQTSGRTSCVAVRRPRTRGRRDPLERTSHRRGSDWVAEARRHALGPGIAAGLHQRETSGGEPIGGDLSIGEDATLDVRRQRLG